ncbi:MAG: polysaccharide biosynthesis tyrosine autokinase [Mycobacteriales bacterium]
MEPASFVGVLRRRLLAVLACLVAGLAGAAVLLAGSPSRYSSTADVFVNVPSASSPETGVQGVQLTGELLPSYAQLATSRAVAEKVRASLGLTASAEHVRGQLSAKVLPLKLILEVTAQDSDPERSRQLADAATAALADTVKELERDRSPSAAVELQVIDPALRGHRTAPRTTYDLVLGLLLGLVSGVVLALVLEGLDRTVRTAEQAEEVTGAAVLGVVPRLSRRQAGRALPGDEPAAEAFRSLRTAVRFATPTPSRILLVTSPSEAEGKTTAALNLALALARSGARTVLVDADLRRGRVAGVLGLDATRGLSDVVTGAATLERCLQGGPDGLIVLAAGALPPNPSEVVGSKAMADLLTELEGYADAIVVDAPPVLPVTDATVLATQADGVLLVLRTGRTRRALAAAARRQLAGVGAPVLGCVLNGSRAVPVGGYAAAPAARRDPAGRS